MILRSSLWHDCVEILVKSFFRGPCMMLYRSLREDLVEILARSKPGGPCVKTSQVPCILVWKLLCEAVARFFYYDFVRSSAAADDFAAYFVSALAWIYRSRSFATRCQKILSSSRWNHLTVSCSAWYCTGPLSISCADPSEILSKASAWSCTGPCEDLRKSPREIL